MLRLGASQIKITGGFAALASCDGSSTKKVTPGTTIPRATQALILILILILGSNSNSIFKPVTALIVKAMRNKKRRRRIFIGPCTKPAYTKKGFYFRVFHKTNEFFINASFFRLFLWPVCNFGPLYSNERKSQSETKKTTCHNSSRKAVQKGLCKHLLSAIIT